MKLVALGRDTGRLALSSNPHVQTIVAVCLEHRYPEVLQLLYDTLWGPPRPVTTMTIAYLVGMSGVPGIARGRAEDLADAALRVASIGSVPYRKALRGAVVEDLTEALLNDRANPLIEVVVELTPGVTLNPQDLLIDSDPLEVYESKAGLGHLNQGDVNDFDLITQAAQAEGRGCVPAIATLASRADLQLTLRNLQPVSPIYSAARDDLYAIANDRPLVRVAP